MFGEDPPPNCDCWSLYPLLRASLLEGSKFRPAQPAYEQWQDLQLQRRLPKIC